MPDMLDRKRKRDGGPQQQPSKKFHPGEFRNHKNPRSLASHGLPPLPEIDDHYRSVVFTHPSQAHHDVNSSYDRLEFLGDAYLELYATQLIFDRYPDLEVGRLSKIREALVRNETIGQYASLYGLDKQLKNYKQFQNGSPAIWLKIKGDVFEAYVAAVVLSQGSSGSTARKWLQELWEPKMQAAAASNPSMSRKSKEELAKKVLMKGVKLNYVDEKAPIVYYGQGHEEFFIGVYLSGLGWDNQYLGSGRAFSRVEAGQAAAADALNNHPLIDQISTKRLEILAQREIETAPENETKMKSV